MKTALLIIDVQRGFFDVSPRPMDADEVVQRINALSARARAVGVPVVYIQHEDPADNLVPGTDGWQLHDALNRGEADTFIRKATPDSFLRTDLAERLTALGVQRVVICGYATEACIDSTTRRAASLGFPVVLVSDAHTTNGAPHASAAAIRTHHNVILSTLWFGSKIDVMPESAVTF